MQVESDSNLIEFLSWDSDFFGHKVGSITIDSLFDIDRIYEAGVKKNFELLYIKSNKELQNNSSNFDVKLVDRKATYSRSLTASKVENRNNNISSYPITDIPNDQLIELSIIAGGHSRFKIDSKILNSKFEELYQKWIVNSVSRKFADEVLIYKKNEADILGMITVKINEQIANIGLLSVMPNQHGKGIGSALINSALNFTKRKGIESVEVVTQTDNIQACRFYEKNNFSLKSTEYIYHFWLL